MADLVPNIAKGRIIELVNRVKQNDPANAGLVVVALVVTGDQDDAMRDADTLDALLALSNVAEATNGSYARIVLDQDDVDNFAADDSNNRNEVDLIADIALGSPAAGDVWTDLAICYDPDTTGGADTAIIPLGIYDFPVTPDGSALTATRNAAGILRAA